MQISIKKKIGNRILTQRDILTLPSLVVTIRTTTYSIEIAAFRTVILRCIARDSENEELVCPYLFSSLYDVSTSSCAHLTIIVSSSSICLCHSSLLPLIPCPPSVL